MEAASFTSRLRRRIAVTDWPWWQLPLGMRLYVAAPPIACLAVIGVLADRTDWRLRDLAMGLLLLGCALITVASTPRVAYKVGGITRDFSNMWALPAAILLPPIYATLITIPITAGIYYWVHRGVVYRRVFTAASISLPYAGASIAFHRLPVSFAGGAVGSGLHALTWAVAVAACEIIAGKIHHFLIAAAVKLSDPKVRIRDFELNREALQGDFVEIHVAVLITVLVAVSPALAVLAVPMLFLLRRFIIHPALLAQSRVDSKTGLLNVSTWEAEAESELSRSMRTRSPLAVAIVDIDHFKAVNDTHGHLVGDRVLRAVADALTSHLRPYDRAGRFGGEEFVLLLAQTGQNDACRIAERLRGHMAGLAVPIDDRPSAPAVRLTISIGVTAMERGEPLELADLLAAADSALYHAKQTGRNQVATQPAKRNMGLDAEFTGQHTAEIVQVDPSAASLRPLRSR